MWGIYWTSHILQNFVLDIADLHSLFKNSSWITENCVYSSYYWSSWLMSIRIKTNVNLPWHEFFNWSCKIRASQNVVWKRLASRSHKVIHRPQSRKTSQPNAFYNFKKHRCTPSPPYLGILPGAMEHKKHELSLRHFLISYCLDERCEELTQNKGKLLKLKTSLVLGWVMVQTISLQEFHDFMNSRVPGLWMMVECDFTPRG